MPRSVAALILLIPSLAFAQNQPEPIPQGTGKAILFPDGRTVVVLIDGLTRRFHLIGVQPIDPKAGQLTLKTMLDGHLVRVETDPGLTTDPADGVPLAYLYRQADNLPVNRELITIGAAKLDDRRPFLKATQFRAAQDEAQIGKRGGWADPPPKAQIPAAKPMQEAVVVRPDPIPDPTYVPAPGDRAILHDLNGRKGDCWLASDFLAFQTMADAGRAGDEIGLQELIDSGRMELVPTGTNVLVITYHDYRTIGRTSTCEVRILDGELKGKKYWAYAQEVVRLIDPPPIQNRHVPQGVRRPRRR